MNEKNKVNESNRRQSWKEPGNLKRRALRQLSMNSVRKKIAATQQPETEK